MKTMGVVGAGLEGLDAALALARKGHRVLIWEARPNVGGLAGATHIVDGEPLGLSPWIEQGYYRPQSRGGVQRSGTAAGIPPIYLPDGTGGPGLLLAHDPEEASAELSRLDPAERDGYFRFRSLTRRIAPVLARLIDEPLPDLSAPETSDLWTLLKGAVSLRLLGRRDMFDLLRLAPMPMGDSLDEFFVTDEVKVAFAARHLLGEFLGPKSPGGTAKLLLLESLRQPPVEGRSSALVDMRMDEIRRLGSSQIQVFPGSRVSRIAVDQGQVCAVALENGSTVAVSGLVWTAHPKELLDLLPTGALDPISVSPLACIRSRGTAARIEWLLEGEEMPRWRGRPAENITEGLVGAFNLIDIEKAFDPVKYGSNSVAAGLPGLAHIWVSPTERRDRWRVSALAGFVTCSTPPSESEQFVAGILNTAATEIPSLKARIVAQRVLMPQDIEREYGSYGGHLGHTEFALDQLLVRPTIGLRGGCLTSVEGLALAGRGCHPYGFWGISGHRAGDALS